MVTTVVLLWTLFFLTVAVAGMAIAEGTRGYRERKRVPVRGERPKPPEF